MNEEVVQELHADTLITKPMMFFGTKELYHVNLLKLPVILPMSLNTGNKLAGPRFSSWWTPKEDTNYTWLFMIYFTQKYREDKWKGIFFFAEDFSGKKRLVVYLTESFFKKHRQELLSFKAYEYIKYFKGYEVGRGREYSVDEYTCDDPVVPDKMKEYGWTTVSKYIRIIPDMMSEKYAKKHRILKAGGFHFQNEVHPNKPWLYHDYDKILPQLYKYYDKYPGVVPYYRVTYHGVGIYEAVKKKLPIETWNRFLKSSAATWLPRPKQYDDNVLSYFTNEGIVEFCKQTLPFIYTVIPKEEIQYKSHIKLGKVLYKDKYQIITEKPNIFSSPNDTVRAIKRINHVTESADKIVRSMEYYNIPFSVIGERNPLRAYITK